MLGRAELPGHANTLTRGPPCGKWNSKDFPDGDIRPLLQGTNHQSPPPPESPPDEPESYELPESDDEPESYGEEQSADGDGSGAGAGGSYRGASSTGAAGVSVW